MMISHGGTSFFAAGGEGTPLASCSLLMTSFACVGAFKYIGLLPRQLISVSSRRFFKLARSALRAGRHPLSRRVRAQIGRFERVCPQTKLCEAQVWCLRCRPKERRGHIWILLYSYRSKPPTVWSDGLKRQQITHRKGTYADHQGQKMQAEGAARSVHHTPKDSEDSH